MKEKFEPRIENQPAPQEQIEKQSNWLGKQLKSLVETSPLLQEWRESERKDEVVMTVGGMAGTALIVGAAINGGMDAKFVAEALAIGGGALAWSEIVARTARFLREKFGSEPKEK